MQAIDNDFSEFERQLAEFRPADASSLHTRLIEEMRSRSIPRIVSRLSIRPLLAAGIIGFLLGAGCVWYVMPPKSPKEEPPRSPHRIPELSLSELLVDDSPLMPKSLSRYQRLEADSPDDVSGIPTPPKPMTASLRIFER